MAADTREDLGIKSPITIGQKKQIMKLLSFSEEAKEEAVVSMTACPSKTHLSDLTFKQANELIGNLGGHPAIDYDWAHFDKFNAQHAYLLSLCIQAGWTIRHAKYGYVANLKRLSDWLKSERCPVRKPLKSMSKQETSKVIYAFEQVVKTKYK